MNYPKEVMTIKELTEMGFKDKYLRSIYRDRRINNKSRPIAWKEGGEEKPKSTILFDTQEFEKYRRAQCTGV